jgi:hypothetical protein
LKKIRTNSEYEGRKSEKMRNPIRKWQEKRLAKKQQKEAAEKKILFEQRLERCKKGEHEWQYSYEVQGDGDPNVEGYVLITKATCQVCHETEVEIEPYDKEDD